MILLHSLESIIEIQTMATVKTNTDVFEKAWEGFKGTDWKEKQVCLASYKQTTHHMMVMKAFAGPTERSLKIKKSLKKLKPTTKKLVSQWILSDINRRYSCRLYFKRRRTNLRYSK